MSGELRLRREIVKILKPLNAQPVENTVKVGCPDIEYHGGWIEVKRTREWPARPDTVVRLDHDLTEEQRIWIKRRIRVGGVVWVLIQIDQTYLLFDGVAATMWVGSSNKRDLMNRAVHRCMGLTELRRKLLSWVR